MASHGKGIFCWGNRDNNTEGYVLKLEATIQTEILKKLRKRTPSFTYKHPPQPSGIPDIHHIEGGRSFWFEVKRSKHHKPTDLQLLRHRLLIEAGAIVAVVWSWGQVQEVLDAKRI